jgi:hypothetical protein
VTYDAGVRLGLVIALAGCGDNLHPYRELSWGVGVHTFDAVELGLATSRADPSPLIDQLVDETHVTIPTYDGSGQVVHPDVLLESGRLVMAMTPYPFSNGRDENPSIVVSADGITFTTIRDNPLVPAPPFDHNDDPDIRRDPRTGDYELLYLETLRPDLQTVVALRSPDLLTWTRRDAIAYDIGHGEPFIVSPAAIDDAGVTHLFYVHLGATSAQLETLTSADGTTWDRTQAAPVQIDLGAVSPWHVDVIRGDGAFGMLLSGFDTVFEHQNLYLATSQDLVQWTLRPEPLLAYTDRSLGLETLYRSSGVVAGGRLAVWYSFQY